MTADTAISSRREHQYGDDPLPQEAKDAWRDSRKLEHEASVSMQLTQVVDSLSGALGYAQPDWWLLDGQYRHGTITLVARWNVDPTNPYFGQRSGMFSGHMVGADEMILSLTLPDSTPNPHSSKWGRVR